ncbi:unnamed protein product [Meloidogyne enterolobii]|uniref:Uncharacterized protein n=1 Tax=Meloidogyne enterolobii TaxID=390850 RepID=A0ACB0YK34_MELEN
MEEAKKSTAQMARKNIFFSMCATSLFGIFFFSSLIFAYFSIQSPAHFFLPCLLIFIFTSASNAPENAAFILKAI